MEWGGVVVAAGEERDGCIRSEVVRMWKWGCFCMEWSEGRGRG